MSPRIVVAFDMKVSNDLTSSENAFKMEKLGRLWWALIAGDVSTARELGGVYRRYLAIHEHEIDQDNVLEHLHIPAESFLDLLRDRLCKEMTSLNYHDFHLVADHFPESVTWSLVNMRPEVELLIVGYVGGTSLEPRHRLRLFKYSRGLVFSCDNHAAIGSGTAIAEAALAQRDHSELWNLPRTVYVVYEAQRLGQRAPGVGEHMRLEVFDVLRRPDHSALPPTDEGAFIYGVPASQEFFSTLEDWYGQFGLHDVDLKIKLPPDAFYGLPATGPT
jgi:hypothetical protein